MKRKLLIGVVCLFSCVSVAKPVPEDHGGAGSVLVANGTLTVGPLERVLTKFDRDARGLTMWPDGNMGVLKSGALYTFFTSNGSNIAKTRGTLDAPAQISSAPRIQIQNLRHRYDFISGGPVYQDPQSGTLLMFYHAEKWINGKPARFWSLLGMAKSTDAGESWIDLGEIITPNIPFDMTPHEITGGTFAIVGDYFYVYFRDRLQGGGNINLAVARARIADVLAAAVSNSVTAWTKYRNGSWSQPGLWGASSALEFGNPASNFMSVSYNSFAKKYLLVVVGISDKNWDLYLTESADGINWSNRIQLESDPGESYAPTIIGLGDEPRDSDQKFYVYYSYSRVRGANRWSNAVLARRLITLNGRELRQ
jgi:hypothetical protein